jgi:hypothetical protein
MITSCFMECNDQKVQVFKFFHFVIQGFKKRVYEYRVARLTITQSSLQTIHSRKCFSGSLTAVVPTNCLNPLNAELNPICYLLALLGAHHILHVSRIRVNITKSCVFPRSIFLCFFNDSRNE